MTGTAKVKPPKNNAEWARNTQKRLDQVEHPASARVGQWVVSTEPDTGNLIASFVNGGSVILASPPDLVENPDEVQTEQPLPSLRLLRTATQTIPLNTAANIAWDTLGHNVGGWGVSTLPVTEVAVPESGLYVMIYKLARVSETANRTKAYMSRNGTLFSGTEYRPDNSTWQVYYLTEMLELDAGDTLSCGAYSLLASDYGSAGNDPGNITSFSLRCLERVGG